MARWRFGVIVSVFVSLFVPITPAPSDAQLIGRWDIEFSSPDELMVSLTADRPLFASAPSSRADGREEGQPISGVRPAFYLHCRNGRTRVFLEPPEPTFVFQFDAGDLVLPRYVERVERGANRPALQALSEPGEWIGLMLAGVELRLIDRHAGGGRTTFALDGLQVILTELEDPCGWLEGR